MDMDTELQELSKLGGTIGTIAGAVFLLVRLYRLPLVQMALPDALQWKNVPLVTRYVALLSLSGVGAALSSYAMGLTWGEVARAAVGAMLAAVSSDQVLSSAPAQAAAKVVFAIKPPPLPDTGLKANVPSLPPSGDVKSPAEP
jgi:hypothetical protein